MALALTNKAGRALVEATPVCGLPGLYSQNLLNNLFRHPYTRIDFVVRDLEVSRQTASKYLDRLAEKGGVASHFQDEALAYFNKSSNLCVGKGVLRIFNTLTPDAVYERAGKFWRVRLDTDQPGRQQ